MNNNNKRAAYIAIAINFTYYLARACSKKYVLGLAVLYGQSNAVAGFVYSLYTIVQLLAALLVGRLADKYGNKPLLISGSASMAAGALAMAFSTNIYMAALGNILLGAAHGQILISSQSVVVAVDNPDDKSRFAGYFYFSNALGGFIGGAAGGYLQLWDNHLGFLGAVAAAVATLVFAFVIPNIRNPESSGGRSGALKFLSDRYVLANIILSATVLFCTDVLDGYLTEHCREVMISEIAIGWIFGVYNIATCAIRPFLGTLSKKVGLSRTFTVCLILGGISLIATGFIRSVWSALVVVAIVGVTVGLMNPITLLTISAVAAPDKRAQVLSLRIVANAGAQTLSTNVYGVIVGIVGSYAPIFFISGVLMLLVSGLAHKYEKPSKLEEKGQV